jgi:single-strand DNA-binding protein
MMNNFRLCWLTGNLVKDPKKKVLNSGKEISIFTIAINHFGVNEEKRVSYFDIEAWNSSAKYCNANLRKGLRVSLVGNLKQDRWEKDGKINSKVKIVATHVYTKTLDDSLENKKEKELTSLPKAS